MVGEVEDRTEADVVGIVFGHDDTVVKASSIHVEPCPEVLSRRGGFSCIAILKRYTRSLLYFLELLNVLKDPPLIVVKFHFKILQT